MASERCWVWMDSLPSKSAAVRATFNTRSYARAERWSSLVASLSISVPSASKPAKGPDLPGGQPAVRLSGALVLDRPRRHDPRADRGAGFGQGLIRQMLVFDRRNLDVQVDAVEQRAADALTVTLHLHYALQRQDFCNDP